MNEIAVSVMTLLNTLVSSEEMLKTVSITLKHPVKKHIIFYLKRTFTVNKQTNKQRVKMVTETLLYKKHSLAKTGFYPGAALVNTEELAAAWLSS